MPTVDNIVYEDVLALYSGNSEDPWKQLRY